jgi:hypothetical protein
MTRADADHVYTVDDEVQPTGGTRHEAARSRLPASAVLLVAALGATFPVFTSAYREMVFQTTPRDDYAPYLLWMAGERASAPRAPMAYRVLSVAAAVPFYYALPVYRFTRLPDADPAYLRATQALAFTSWLALAGLAVIVYRITRDRLRASRMAALTAFFATPLYAHYTAVVGVDPLALLLIATGFYWLAAPAAFAPIVVASAAFNEKVPLVLGLLLGARVVAAPREAFRRLPVQLLACAAALVAYAAVRHALRIPGNENQMQPLSYLYSLLPMIRLTLSAKGLLLNVIPVALCLVAYAVAWRGRDAITSIYWSRADVLVPLGLALIGIAIDVKYTLGRLVLHALPLVVPAAVAALEGRSPPPPHVDPAPG